MKKPFLYIIVLITFCKCTYEVWDNREITINNNSKKSIFCILSENDMMNNAVFYYEYKEGFKEEDRGKYDTPFVFEEIKKETKDTVYDRPPRWELYFNRLEDKKARLFIIQKDSVNKYGWHKIFKMNLYNKKYYITLEDLEKTNWEIEYNGEW